MAFMVTETRGEIRALYVPYSHFQGCDVGAPDETLHVLRVRAIYQEMEGVANKRG